MTIYGADPDALRRLAHQLDQAAHQLTQLGSQTSEALRGSSWKGADADAVRSEWDGAHLATVRKAAAAVEQAAKDLARNADEQTRTSAADGAGGTGTPGAPGTTPPGHYLPDPPLLLGTPPGHYLPEPPTPLDGPGGTYDPGIPIVPVDPGTQGPEAENPILPPGGVLGLGDGGLVKGTGDTGLFGADGPIHTVFDTGPHDSNDYPVGPGDVGYSYDVGPTGVTGDYHAGIDGSKDTPLGTFGGSATGDTSVILGIQGNYDGIHDFALGSGAFGDTNTNVGFDYTDPTGVTTHSFGGQADAQAGGHVTASSVPGGGYNVGGGGGLSADVTVSQTTGVDLGPVSMSNGVSAGVGVGASYSGDVTFSPHDVGFNLSGSLGIGPDLGLNQSFHVDPTELYGDATGAVGHVTDWAGDAGSTLSGIGSHLGF